MRRLTEVAVNEWGEPEPTPEQESFAEDVAAQAGCEYPSCTGLTICEPCGLLVCLEHTHGAIECAEAGPHHPDCRPDCAACATADAIEAEQEWAERVARGWAS